MELLVKATNLGNDVSDPLQHGTVCRCHAVDYKTCPKEERKPICPDTYTGRPIVDDGDRDGLSRDG